MVRAAGIDNPEEFRNAMATEEVHLFLRERLKALAQANAIALVGADGKLVNTSRVWPVQAIDLSDRDYFSRLQPGSEPGVFISAPAISRSSGIWSFFLARRVDGPRGEPIGLVLCAIDVQYLEDFFRAINLRNGGSVAVFRRDGTMLARYPHIETMVGGKLPEQSPFYARVKEGGGAYSCRVTSTQSRASSRSIPCVIFRSSSRSPWRRTRCLPTGAASRFSSRSAPFAL
jgi:hypothetical protein